MQILLYTLILGLSAYALTRLVPLIERLERASFLRAEADMEGREPEPQPSFWRDTLSALLLALLFLAALILAFAL